MSDMYGGGYGDVWQEPSEDELLATYSQMLGGLPGNTPAQQLNYFQDIVQSLKTFGIDPAGLFAPTQGEPVAPFVEPINQTGAIYGTDPMYASIFQAVEEGMSPIEAAKLAREQFGWAASDTMNAEQEFQDTVVRIATDYARDRVSGQQAYQDWAAAASQAEQGQPSAMATASEYDLMGAPDVDTLMEQYRQRMSAKAPAGVPQRQMLDAATARQMGSAGSANAGGGGLTVDVARQMVQRNRDAAADRAADPTRLPGQEGAPRPNAPISTIEQLDAGYDPRTRSSWQKNNPANRSFFDQVDNTARQSVERRVDRAKTNRVRSEPNRQTVNTLMALASILQR